MAQDMMLGLLSCHRNHSFGRHLNLRKGSVGSKGGYSFVISFETHLHMIKESINGDAVAVVTKSSQPKEVSADVLNQSLRNGYDN